MTLSLPGAWPAVQCDLDIHHTHTLHCTDDLLIKLEDVEPEDSPPQVLEVAMM